jgi:hypothetical protein
MAMTRSEDERREEAAWRYGRVSSENAAGAFIQRQPAATVAYLFDALKAAWQAEVRGPKSASVGDFDEWLGEKREQMRDFGWLPDALA